MHVVEQGQGPAVVFCHGFPDGWRSWRRQMRAVSDAGFRAVAFDMRGYGDSSAPPEVTDYSLFKIAGDIVGLCEALEAEDACLVGHDFGAASVWTASLMRPDLFRAVFGVNVPPGFVVGPNMLAEMRRQGKNDFYMFKMMELEADAQWADAGTTIPGIRYWTSGLPPADQRWNPFDPDKGPLRPSPIGTPPFCDADDTEALIASFQQNGFHYPLNYYRALESFLDQREAWVGAKIVQPSFFLTGALDGQVRLRKVTEADLRPTLTSLRGVAELDAGHWVHQERTDDFNGILLRFLADLTN